MKSIIVIFSFFFLIQIFGCTKDLSTQAEGYTVSGTVFSEGEPIQGALVDIDQSPNLRALTDSEGNFKIVNVPSGNHTLTAYKSLPEGNFLERTTIVNVENDMTIDNLILPVPVHMYLPEKITDVSMLLKWSPTDAFDFREYKVYQHTTSGLDETTGTLVHVSTQITDTTFTVGNLNPLTEYFFRVYIMNQYGKLGGSNIVSGQTLNKEIIKNGSFEILRTSSGYPEDWQAYSTIVGYYFVDSLISQAGNYSIRIENAPGVNIYYQFISPQLLISNDNYKLTYWIKHEELLNSGDEFAVFLSTIENNWNIQANTIRGPKAASDWTLYEYEFTAPSISTSNFIIGFYFFISGGKKAWLDNVSLIKLLN